MAYFRLHTKTTISERTRVNRAAWQPGQGGLLALATTNGGQLVRTGLVKNSSVYFGAGWMEELAWSPAGDLLATVGDGGAFIWNSNGAVNKELQLPDVLPVLNCSFIAPKFSNDGSFIIVSYEKWLPPPLSHLQFHKLETSTGDLQQSFRIPTSEPRFGFHNALWKDELEVFCQDENHSIKLWRIGQDDPMKTLTSPASKVTQWSFNAKTNILAFTEGYTPTVSLWKTDTPDMAVSLLTGHVSAVVRTLWQPDHSDILATLDSSGGVRIWNTTSHTTLHTYKVFQNYAIMNNASLSPDGRFIAFASLPHCPYQDKVKIVKFDTGGTAAVCEVGGEWRTGRVLEWSTRGDKLVVERGPLWLVVERGPLCVFNVDMINFGINLKGLSLMKVASLLEGNLVNGEVEAREFLTTKIPKELVDDVVSYM